MFIVDGRVTPCQLATPAAAPGERSAGTEGEEVVERLGVVAPGVGRRHRVENHFPKPGLGRDEGQGPPALLSGDGAPKRDRCHEMINTDSNRLMRSGIHREICYSATSAVLCAS
jgi:hypothetical protein